MITGYLFDNNALAHWFSENKCFCQRVQALPPQSLIYTSAVILGEITYAHLISPTTDLQKRRDYEQFVRSKFHHRILPVTHHTIDSYAYLRSNLFNVTGSKTSKRPELWEDPATGAALGIEENDLWLAAQSIEHNLVLVTNDKMNRIRKADKENRLQMVDWAKP